MVNFSEDSRYIAPGVPRLSRSFVDEQLEVMTDEVRGYDSKINKNLVDVILNLRRKSIKIESRRLKRNPKLTGIGMQQFVIAASMVQPALTLVSSSKYFGLSANDVKSLDMDFSEKNAQYFRSLAKQVTGDFWVFSQVEKDPELFKAIINLSRIELPQLLIKNPYNFINICTTNGVRVAYNLLRCQHRIYESEDKELLVKEKPDLDEIIA